MESPGENRKGEYSSLRLLVEPEVGLNATIEFNIGKRKPTFGE